MSKPIENPSVLSSFEKPDVTISEKYKLAHPFLRVVNFSIDFLIWFIMTFISIVIIDSAFPNMSHLGINTLAYTIMIVLFIGYFFSLEFFFQKTLGKFITGTIVVNLNGGKPSSKSLLIRSLIRTIPLEWLTYLFMRNGAHDVLSKTIVIRTKKKGKCPTI